MHGEIFENPFFDFVQTVVICVQNVFSTLEIQAHLTLSLPRHLHQPVDVGAHHGGFCGHWRHLLELVQLRLGLGHCIFRQTGSIDAFFQLFDFIVTFVTITQLFLNGLHLLIQVVLALAALHLLFNAATDAFFNLQQVDLGIQQGQNVFNTGLQVDDFEDFLLLLDLECHMGSHRIDQTAWLINAVKR